MKDEAGPRYAVYYVPAPGTVLSAMGRAILGYDPDIGMDVPFAESCGLTDAAWAEATHEPRRYGFHATLKAPFRLQTGVTEDALVREAAKLAARLPRAKAFALTVKALTRFVALVPSQSSPDVDRLAFNVVTELDSLRAPLTAWDRERRLAAGLTERQRAYLEAYGYPYVGEEFRFHLTLAGPLAAPELDNVLLRLETRFAELDGVCAVDALTVLRQDHGQARFRVIARCPLGPAPDAAVPG